MAAWLRQVVNYYNRGGNPGARNIDPRVQPLYLGAQEIDDLLAFLASLASEPSSARPLRSVALR